jgi:hypothetical protein
MLHLWDEFQHPNMRFVPESSPATLKTGAMRSKRCGKPILRIPAAARGLRL